MKSVLVKLFNFSLDMLMAFLLVPILCQNLRRVMGKGAFETYANNIQSTVVISKSMGLSETLQDIRTSTYQICGIEVNNKSHNHI